MAKITPTSVRAGFNLTTINDNFDSIALELNTKVLYRDNPTGEPNGWETQQDANSQRLINLSDAVSPSEPATLRQLNALSTGVQSIGIARASVTATAGQTVFAASAYTLGSNNLSVYINGVRQDGSAYTETSTTSFTLSEGAQVGDNVEYLINEYPELVGTTAASAVTYTYPGGVATNLQAKLEDSVSSSDFGAIGDGLIDDTVAIQEALNTGKNVSLGEGVFRLTDELLIVTPGQKVYGAGGGTISEDEQSIVGAKTTFFINRADTFPPYRKTRRLAPETGGDPSDDPLSVVINNQGEAAVFENFAIELDCDYTDSSSTNLGGDVDVGFFNGCRGDVEVIGVTILGYFRKASLYEDVTRGTTTAEFTSPGGTLYPSGGTNGADRVHKSNFRCKGGLKGVYVAGALESASGDYFDIVTSTVLSAHGGRGGSGFSDNLIDGNSFIQSREHHSGYRATDPTMDTSTENIDLIAAAIAVDGRRGSSTQKRIRRMNITNTRIKTIEAARIFTDRVYELNLNWVHTEPASGTVRDTGGSVITITDYDTESYGPIACVATDAVNFVGTDQVHAFGMWGTGIQEQWSDALVDNFTQTREHVDTGTWIPEFQFVTAPTYTTNSGTWTRVDNKMFCTFFIDFSVLDTADGSAITIQNLPENVSGLGALEGKISFKSSTSITPATGKAYQLEEGTGITNIQLADVDGTTHKYNGGDIATSGTFTGSFSYRI